ncbi:hypothetical protein B0H11DRAFT_2240853 [Mycena galericulata]|nr:hypothetical protein B0H11DRAFT_2240853 [Mycena galericulata]
MAATTNPIDTARLPRPDMTMTDRVREKLLQLRIEADHSIVRAEVAETKNKRLEKTVLEKEQEIKNLIQEMDVRAEECERQLHAADQERDQWKQKYEAMEAKYRIAKAQINAPISHL